MFCQLIKFINLGARLEGVGGRTNYQYFAMEIQSLSVLAASLMSNLNSYLIPSVANLEKLKLDLGENI